MGKRKNKPPKDIDMQVKSLKRTLLENTRSGTSKAEIFTSIEFCKLLQDPVLYIKGLQRFCQAGRHFRDSLSSHDIIKAYISVSPDCAEIFKCIERSKTSPVNVCLVFETFVSILLRTAGDLSQTFSSVGVTICRRLMQSHVREIYGALGLKNPARVIVPTLRMLTSLVMQGKECANDVATNLDLSGKLMSSLANYKTDVKHGGQSASTNVRLCFVRFVLSFFMAADVETIKQVLEARGFVDAIFRGLPADPASVLHLFLSTLQEKVIRNIAVPKTNKIKLLAGRGVLNSIAELFEWDGTVDCTMVKADTEDGDDSSCLSGKDQIHKLAYDFLYHSCCPYKYGINFKDKEFGTASRSQNHVLLKFLMDLKTAASHPQARKLTIEILKSCPDLITKYLTTCTLSFEPRPTEKWFQNCSLVRDIYKAQCDVAPALTDIAKSRQLPKHEISRISAMIIPSILPPVFLRAPLKMVLKHANADVRLLGLEIFNLSLEKLRHSMEFLHSEECWSKSIYSEKDRQDLTKKLKDEISKMFPDIISVVGIWAAGSSDKTDKGNKAQEGLLEALSLYQQLLPESFSQSTYDFSKLLHNVDLDAGVITTATRHAIDLLSHSPHKFRWFKKGDNKKTTFYQLIKLVHKAITAKSSDEKGHAGNLEKAFHLLKKVAIYNDMCDKASCKELLSWIRHLNVAQNESDIEFLLQFLDDCATAVAKRPHRYVNKIAILAEHDYAETEPPADHMLKFDEDWWNSLPDVEIKLATESNVSELKANFDISKPSEFAIASTSQFSLLLNAALESNTFSNTEELYLKHQDLIDRYLFKVTSDLFYQQAVFEDDTPFVNVIWGLTKEIPENRSLPGLFSLVNEIANWCHPSKDLSAKSDELMLHITNSVISGTTGDEVSTFTAWFVETLSASKKLSGSPKKREKCANRFTNIQEKCSVADQFTDLLKDSNSGVMTASFCVETILSQSLFYLRKLTDMFFAECDRTDTSHLLSRLVFLSGLLQMFVDAFPPKESCATTALAESLQCLNKLLLSPFLTLCFLNEERLHVINDVNRVTKNLISSYFRFNQGAFERNPVLVLPYLDKLTNNLCETVHISEGRKPIFVEALRDSFEDLCPMLPVNHLKKIIACYAKNLNDLSNFSSSGAFIISKCLAMLLRKSSGNPLSSETVKQLLEAIPGLGPKRRRFFLEGVLALCRKFPSSALQMDGRVLSWCVANADESDDIVQLVETAIFHNFSLQPMFVKEVCGFEVRESTLILKLLALATKLPVCMQSSSFYDQALSKKLWTCLKKVVPKLILCERESSNTDFSMKSQIILTWMMNSKSGLSDKVLSKLIAFPHSISGGTCFAIRWIIVERLFKYLEEHNHENTREIRREVLRTLVQLSRTAACCVGDHDEFIQLRPIVEAAKSLMTKLELSDLEPQGEEFFADFLRYQFCNPIALDYLTQFVVCCEGDRTEQNATVLYKMVTSHSSFLTVMLSTVDDPKHNEAKPALLRLLHSLIERCDKTLLRSNDYFYLLSSYHATLSEADQCLFKILLLYETNEVSSAECTPFLWGNTALESYQARKNIGDTLYKKPSPNRILACIDPAVMANTLNRYPLQRRLLTIQAADDLSKAADRKKAKHVDREKEASDSEPVYDPCFLLSAFSDLLAPEHLVDCRSFLRQGALSFLLLSLASHCPKVRTLAAACLAKYYDHAEPLWFSEKNLTLHLLRVARNAVTLDGPHLRKIPCVTAQYLSKMAQLLFQPAEHIYAVMYRHLLVKPGLDVNSIPEFYVLFYSSTLEYKVERAWILELIEQGMRDTGDYRVIESRQVLRILMTYHSSPTSDERSRRLVLKVLERCVAVRAGAYDLINKQGILPWLLHVALQQRDTTLATRDAYPSPPKRRDATCDLVSLAATLWRTLDTSDAQREKLARDMTSQPNADDVTTAPKLLAPVSPTIASQMVDFCVELLQNLLKLAGQDYGDPVTSVELTPDLASDFSDVVNVINGVFDYAREFHSARDAIFLRAEQVSTIAKTSETLEKSDSNLAVTAALFLLNWQPFGFAFSTTPDKMATVLRVTQSLITWQYRGPLLLECLKWFQSWVARLTTVGLKSDELATVKEMSLKLIDFLSLPDPDQQDFSEHLCVLYNVCQIICGYLTSDNDQDKTSANLEEYDRQRLQLVLDTQIKSCP